MSAMRLPWKSKKLGTDFARDWRGEFAENVAAKGPTVLLETADGEEAVGLWRALGREGLRMQWCPGPDREADRRCTLVASGQCALLEQADVVVSHLDFTCSAARDTLAALRENQRENPSGAHVVVAAPNFARARFPEITDGVTLVPDYLTGYRVVTAVNQACSPSDDRVSL